MGVQGFFRKNPCGWLARIYTAVRRNKQGLMLVAISWVDMPGTSLARYYKHLVDESGTGNIAELSRESGPYRNVKFAGRYYASGIIGAAMKAT
jgi:hypothetical protein